MLWCQLHPMAVVLQWAHSVKVSHVQTLFHVWYTDNFPSASNSYKGHSRLAVCPAACLFPPLTCCRTTAVTTEVMRSAKILMQVRWEKAESLLPCLCPCSAGSTCSTECFQAPSRDVLRKQKRLEYFVDLSLVFLLAWLLRDKQAPSWFNREIQAIFSTWSTQDLDAWSVQAWSCF